MKILYIGGLPYDLTSEQLRDVIAGDVLGATAEVICDRETGRSRGFGFVIVPGEEDAFRLIEMWHEKELHGRTVIVNEARPRQARPRSDLSVAVMERIATPAVQPPVIRAVRYTARELINYFAAHPSETRSMQPRLFEELIAELFQRSGYEIELTKQTRDGGIDIIAISQREISIRCLVECKRLELPNKVPIGTVRELYGVRQYLGGTKGILVTTSYFTSDALSFIEQNKWEMEGKDYGDVVAWLGQATRALS